MGDQTIDILQEILQPNYGQKTLRDEFAIQLMPFYISNYVDEEEAIRLCWAAVDKVLKVREAK